LYFVNIAHDEKTSKSRDVTRLGLGGS